MPVSMSEYPYCECEPLAEASWLKERDLFYWGDIDTHGFAILDQLRGHFPHAWVQAALTVFGPEKLRGSS